MTAIAYLIQEFPMSFSPIAVLDTGVGGLSVVKTIQKLLPKEDIHYFADTAHLPYGIKSPQLIKYLANKLVKTAIDYSSCKALVVACHTISVNCLKEIEDTVAIPVIGMVKPSLLAAEKLFLRESLASFAVLSTQATLESGIYLASLRDIYPNTGFFHQACGALVSLVEEGSFALAEQRSVLEHFLSDDIKQCDALLLGCTHFSALIPALKFTQKADCHILDGAESVALELALTLEKMRLLALRPEGGQLKVYVTDNEERFKKIAYRFIPEDLSIHVIKNYVTS